MKVLAGGLLGLIVLQGVMVLLGVIVLLGVLVLVGVIVFSQQDRASGMIVLSQKDGVIFPSLFKKGTLDSVAQHGIQRGWLLPRVT